MKFTMHETGVVSAVGMITHQTIDDFKKIYDKYELRGSTIVFNSSGGIVNAALKFGRILKPLDMVMTVGIVENGRIKTGGSCYSMCPFVMLSGKTRYVPVGNGVAVHQIGLLRNPWNADVSYTEDDVDNIQKSLGDIAKYVQDMGGNQDLLVIAVQAKNNELRVLTRAELKSTRLTNK